MTRCTSLTRGANLNIFTLPFPPSLEKIFIIPNFGYLVNQTFFPVSARQNFSKRDIIPLAIFYGLSIVYILFCPTFNFSSNTQIAIPVFSIYTALLVASLYLIQILKVFQTNKILRYCVAGTLLVITLFFVIFDLSPFFEDKILGFVVPSIPTLITFSFIWFYEIYRIKFSQPHLSLDIFFFLALLPLELSLIGYISKIPSLYGVFSTPLIGMSLPTMTFFFLYFVYIIFSCQKLVTHRLVIADKWSRNIIVIFWIFWILLIAQYAFYLSSFKHLFESHLINNIIFVLAIALCVQRVLYFFLLKSILLKRFSLITICAVTKKVKLNDGNWIDIETYLKKEHFITPSHSLCPEEIEKIKAWAKD